MSGVRIAWLVTPRGWPGGLVAETTRGRARAVALSAAKELGYPYRLPDFAAVRVPALDEWARSARPGYWTPSAVPGGEAAILDRLVGAA